MTSGVGRIGWMAVGFAIGLAMTVAAVLFVRQFDFFGGGRQIDTSRPSVVQRIQQLQRLETVVFAIDKIVSGGYENRYLPRFLAGDRPVDRVVTSPWRRSGTVDRTCASRSVVQPPCRRPSSHPHRQRTHASRAKSACFRRRSGWNRRRKEAESDSAGGADAGVLQTASTNAAATLKRSCTA
jgi:hypothetical protein